MIRNYFIVYGVIIFVLGILGLPHTPSVVMGCASGALIFVAGVLLPKDRRIWSIVIAAISLLLAGRFVPIFLTTMAIYPAGIIAILSVVGLILALMVLLRKK